MASGDETGAATAPLLLPGTRPDWNALDDPGSDGWTSELFSDRASARLSALAHRIEEGSLTAADLAPLLADDFRCTELRPADLGIVHATDRIEVRRARPGIGATLSHSGPDGLARALQALVAPFYAGDPADAGAIELRTKFKLFGVEVRDGSIATRQLFSLSGRTPEGPREWHATWSASWTEEVEPRLSSLTVESCEETLVAGGPLFDDCTAALFAGEPSYRDQLLVGLHDWLGRIENTRPQALFGHPGIAVGDVNGDGLDDLYLCQELGLPNRLYLQQPDGSVRDVAADAGVDWLHDSRGALLVDLDGDGDQDLVVAVWGNVVLAENAGSPDAVRFRVRTVVPTSDDVLSLSAADFDLDGDLDLYACSYHPDQTLDGAEASVFAGAAESFVFHDANNGAPNRLLRSALAAGRPWSFEDATVEVGLDEENRRFSYAAAWEDVDDDGDPDLYVANDFGRDNLYRNEGGRFREMSAEANVEDSAGGMSITFGDYDRDGRTDAFVSNMFSAAGSRVTRQPAFKPGEPEVRRRLQHFARGNTLLRNLGEGRFEDVTLDAGVEMGRWAWGALFCDLDNDGWEDLIVSNGYMTAGDDGDL